MAQDNPLVGEYTKGICAGSQYWRNLARRFENEKVSIKRAKSDFENPLIKDMNRAIAQSVALSGQGRFGPKTPVGLDHSAPKTVGKDTNVAEIQQQKKGCRKAWKTVSLQELLALKETLCG